MVAFTPDVIETRPHWTRLANWARAHIPYLDRRQQSNDWLIRLERRAR